MYSPLLFIFAGRSKAVSGVISSYSQTSLFNNILRSLTSVASSSFTTETDPLRRCSLSFLPSSYPRPSMHSRKLDLKPSCASTKSCDICLPIAASSSPNKTGADGVSDDDDIRDISLFDMATSAGRKAALEKIRAAQLALG